VEGGGVTVEGSAGDIGMVDISGAKTLVDALAGRFQPPFASTLKREQRSAPRRREAASLNPQRQRRAPRNLPSANGAAHTQPGVFTLATVQR
jgi:hypothetical protein